MQSCNLVAKQIYFHSPRKEIQKAVRKNSDQMKSLQQLTERENEDDSSEKSDPSSADDSSSDGSSIDAAMNGEDDTEQAIYERILAEQEGRESGEERKNNFNQLDELVDKNMINLLIFCTMLTKPPQ